MTGTCTGGQNSRPDLQVSAGHLAYLNDIELGVDESFGGTGWLFRGGIALAGGVGLSLAAHLSGHAWTETVGHAALPLTLAALAIGLTVMITGHLRFWLRDLSSPSLLAIAVLCGLGPLTPMGRVLGWGVGMPLFLSGLLSDAGTVWVHARTRERARDRQRLRGGGPPADLPALALWKRVRRVRLAAAVACGLLAAALVALLPHDPLTPITLLALLVGAAGCLGLPATLLSWGAQRPLVEYDEQRGEWHTTYAGRAALVLPAHRISQAIALDRSPAEASAVLLTLLGQSSLGPMIRRAVAGLPAEQAQRLILHLSLQAGGAETIRYLQPALPPSLHPMAQWYAALAEEAAKPLDLQRWLTVLALQPDPSAFGVATATADVTGALVHAREALLCHEYAPVLDVAVEDLEQLLRGFYGDEMPAVRDPRWAGEDDALSWPAALLAHIERHRMRLL